MGDNLSPSLVALEEGNTILKEKNVFGITCTNKKLLRIVPHPRKRFSSVSVGGSKHLVIFSIHNHESERE